MACSSSILQATTILYCCAVERQVSTRGECQGVRYRDVMAAFTGGSDGNNSKMIPISLCFPGGRRFPVLQVIIAIEINLRAFTWIMYKRVQSGNHQVVGDALFEFLKHLYLPSCGNDENSTMPILREFSRFPQLH